MKTQIRLFLILASIGLMHASLNAQALNGTEIRNNLSELIQDLDLQNKILFVNAWQSGDSESRQNNKEFLRVSNIYQQAKLKNGSSGVVYVNLCLDRELYTWIISTKKDSIVSKYNLENSNEKYNSIVKYFEGKPGNLVIGVDGAILAKDIKKEDCFILFRSLITR